MASPHIAGQRNGPTYCLDQFDDYGRCKHSEFDSLEELAQAVCRLRYECARFSSWHRRFGAAHTEGWLRSRVHAYSGYGRVFDVVELSAWGEKLDIPDTASFWYRWPGYVRRQGSVPGIRKWRGGHSCKSCRFLNEARMNQAQALEEGEPACRPARRPGSLCDSWDGRRRCVERSWKSQHKGCKAWDR